MERLFVLKTRSRTQRATKVKRFVEFSLKSLRCRDPALPPLYGHAYSRPFFSCTRMRISRVYTRMIHRRGFSTLVLFIGSVSLSVCVSVKSHLTYGASVRPENAVTYSAGNEGRVFSETAPLQRSSTPSVVRPCVQSAIFPCVFLVYAHAYFSCA